MNRKFIPYTNFNPDDVTFVLGQDRHGKATINVVGQICLVSPACVTNWPRTTGQGNYGTTYGPTEISKAKFQIDLTDGAVNGKDNPAWHDFKEKLDRLDERLLDFVQNNQMRTIGRRNLSRQEVGMLQLKTARAKFEKATGTLTGHSVQLSTSCYQWDGAGTKVPKSIPIVDCNNAVIATPQVNPGDVVAVCMYLNMVYLNVGGDKFGIHWGYDAVQIVCQRAAAPPPTEMPVFGAFQYDFAQPYTQMQADFGQLNAIDQQFPIYRENAGQASDSAAIAGAPPLPCDGPK